MTKLTHLLFSLLLALNLNAQIDINEDPSLTEIKKQLPANWKMEITDGDIFIIYPYAIQGVFKNDLKEEQVHYNANASPEPLSDTVKIGGVKFILYDVATKMSVKEVKNNQDFNDEILKQRENLPVKMKIETRHGKAGPKSMLMFKSDEERETYYAARDSLDDLLKDEPNYYSEKYCYSSIHYPYLSRDVEWNNKTVLNDVVHIQSMLQSKLKTYPFR